MAVPEPATQNIRQAEVALLLCASRTRLDDQEVARLRELAAVDLDWDHFFNISRGHAVEQLVQKQLSENAADIVPIPVLKKLRTLSQANFARNQVFTAELCRLLRLLEASAITAIPFKGPALALFAYDNLNLRRYVDLDIMVQKQDVLAAREILLADGYESAKSLNLSQQQVLLQTQHNLQFHRDQGRMIVELHWEVASHLFASSVQAEDLWSNLIDLDVNGTSMKSLSADDLLFSLCIHGSRHLWQRLAWICDISELILRHEIDWEVLLERSTNNGSERMFLLGLLLAENLLDASLPVVVRERCELDRALKALADKIIARLFDADVDHLQVSTFDTFRYNIAVRKSFKARAQYMFYMLRPTDGDLKRDLPSSMRFIYYVERPWRLLFKS
ncbi:MAG TPA: nucleotidyltransferase family protein [Pyrinomonadaceae bacterium]|nr:nucleotidyltransferase family protein [Pyrinomonadaceae bacterium]